eukprot:TRINITY_DN7987_c0_g1_i1.p1 TRINITY_DN7987_c0_g1~~TRINITY_DN7987_c0_g1_i1.p1  ORF type:complete len:233 (+),score=29.84 TRINITY_DN7987_c0_g1_i1:59-757(+)
MDNSDSAFIKQSTMFTQDQAKQYAILANTILDKLYGYGTDIDEESFGWKATMLSVQACLLSFEELAEKGTISIESAATAIHDGWAKAAKTVWDDGKYGKRDSTTLNANGEFSESSFTTQPGMTMDVKKESIHLIADDASYLLGLDKYRARLNLAKTPYASLSEEEKPKDRVVAEVKLSESENVKNGFDWFAFTCVVQAILIRLFETTWKGKNFTIERSDGDIHRQVVEAMRA